MIKAWDEVVHSKLADYISKEVYNLKYQYKLKTTMMKDIDIAGIEYTDQYVYDNGQFVSSLIFDGWKNPDHLEFIELIQPIIEFAKNELDEPEKFEIFRVKVNLLLQNETLMPEQYNVPHKDFPDFIDPLHYSLVYYCDDSDGDTVLFEEVHNPLQDYSQQMTVRCRIPPKKNRAVLFASHRWHCSSNPRTHKNRFVINFIFKIKD
jgi:hypothetical protein